MFRLHKAAIIRPYITEYMLDLTLSSSPRRYGTMQPRGLHCVISCFRKTVGNNFDPVVVDTSGMRVKCVRQCWLSTFERRQFAVLQVQFVICIQKNHLTLMETFYVVNCSHSSRYTPCALWRLRYYWCFIVTVYTTVHCRTLSWVITWDIQRTGHFPYHKTILYFQTLYTNPV